MANKITGRVEVLLNGTPVLNKSGATASGLGLSGEPAYERAAVLGDQGLHGFTETPVESRCEITITDRSDVSLDTLARINQDGTLIFRAAGGGGKAYTLIDATCLNNFTLTAGEGETTVAFIGTYWTETVES